jgi:hypothetical protein
VLAVHDDPVVAGVGEDLGDDVAAQAAPEPDLPPVSRSAALKGFGGRAEDGAAAMARFSLVLGREW